MSGPALMATLSVHAGLWGLLNVLPQKAPPLKKNIRSIAVVYRKPAVIVPPPAAPPAPPPPAIKHRHHRRTGAKPPQKKAAAPPPLVTTPASSAPAPDAVTVPIAEPSPTTADLPKIPEASLPEGYVEEAGFTYAPMYRVTQPPKLVQALKLEYPARAREFQKEGMVILEVDIDAQGHVLSARIIEESGWGFGAAALKAVLPATFTPAQIDATAVPVRYRIPIRFQMDFS